MMLEKFHSVVTADLDSPVGVLMAGVTDAGVCMLEFRDRDILETQVARIRGRIGPTEPGRHPMLDRLRRELDDYFEARLKEFTIPLIYPGSPFQVSVWNALRFIPYGETIAYEELARRVGSPLGQRAVGHANGQNPLAIIIPCHRVINKGGKLGGYGGGLWRKRVLLDLERTLEPDLFVGGGDQRSAASGHQRSIDNVGIRLAGNAAAHV